VHCIDLRREAGKKPLGNPNGARAIRRAGKGNTAAVAARKVKADRHAQDVMPVIDDIRAAGILTLRGITAELNERGILAAHKTQWSPRRSRTCWRDPVGYCESSCAAVTPKFPRYRHFPVVG
jgi:hypothetical protein